MFTFVALWHDLSFKLLAWGWLVSLFVLPELFARRLAPEQKYGHKPWYRHLAACGGVCNVLMMMSANLVGFVLGLEGMKHLVVKLVSTPSGERLLYRPGVRALKRGVRLAIRRLRCLLPLCRRSNHV